MMIDLKRFQQVTKSPVALFGNLKKLDDFVAFPEYLNLKPFIAPRREEYSQRPAKIVDIKGAYDPQVIYRLYAVVVHIGNMASTRPVRFPLEADNLF
jgi:ubiquitin carboxyl-terminal hydrolase 16/45